MRQRPVASIVHQGNEAGLRYLHCSLCESEWHLVRAKCSNCEATRDIGYWSLQTRMMPCAANPAAIAAAI
jgi:formate dehydrogenase accessory protein FdhE